MEPIIPLLIRVLWKNVMSVGLVIEKNLYLKGPAKKIIKRNTAEKLKVLIDALSSLFFEINKPIK